MLRHYQGGVQNAGASQNAAGTTATTTESDADRRQAAIRARLKIALSDVVVGARSGSGRVSSKQQYSQLVDMLCIYSIM
jgi:hypothetical protein